MSIESGNDNWSACPQCGQPRLIDPSTGRPQACASCRSHAAGGTGVARVLVVVAGLAALAALFGLCARLLYREMLTW